MSLKIKLNISRWTIENQHIFKVFKRFFKQYVAAMKYDFLQMLKLMFCFFFYLDLRMIFLEDDVWRFSS